MYTTADISGVCDPARCRTARTAFEYQPKKNKFVPQYPGIWPRKSLSVKNEDFVES